MISHLRRTKIIATFGPAITQKIWDFQILKDPKNQAMVEKAYATVKASLLAGVNVVRLNFSHGTYDEQMVRVQLVREVANSLKRPISLMLDTKGPEIRVRDLKNDNGINFLRGEKIVISTTKAHDHAIHGFGVTDSTGTYNMAQDVKVNDTILVDDGKLSLQVLAVSADLSEISCLVINSHLLKSNKRINLPNSDYSIPFLSEKDQRDVEFAIKNNFNYIAASFVNKKANILEIKEILKQHQAEHIQVVAKIETKQAIENLDEILSVADGVMIARGDLGLEIPYYEVPYWGKYIIKKCRHANIPVIMATQMLDSLEKNIIPTRAEASDVFWAVERGVDATMLSGESAQGQFPVNAIVVMSRLDRQSEIFFDYSHTLKSYYPQIPNYHSEQGKLVEQIASIVAPKRQVINEEFDYQAVGVFTNDMQLLKTLSAARLAARVLAFTTSVAIYNTCGILYGITPILVADLNHAQQHAAHYIKHYFDHHIQTSSVQITRKTLVVDHGKLVTMICDAQHVTGDVVVNFLHQNY